MAIGALTMVGFVSMIINIIGLCITYSLYLTLHKFITVSYIVLIVIAILIELREFFNQNLSHKTTAEKSTGVIVYACILGTLGFNVGRAFLEHINSSSVTKR